MMNVANTLAKQHHSMIAAIAGEIQAPWDGSDHSLTVDLLFGSPRAPQIPEELNWFFNPAVKFNLYQVHPFFGDVGSEHDWPENKNLKVVYEPGIFNLHNYAASFEYFAHEIGHALDLVARGKSERLKLIDFGLVDTISPDREGPVKIDTLPSMKHMTMTVCHELRAMSYSKRLREALDRDVLIAAKRLDSRKAVQKAKDIISTRVQMLGNDVSDHFNRNTFRIIKKHGYSMENPLHRDVIFTALEQHNNQYHVINFAFLNKWLDYALPELFAAWDKSIGCDVKDLWSKACEAFAEVNPNLETTFKKSEKPSGDGSLSSLLKMLGRR